MGQGTSSWTDTSKVGSDQRENLGSYSTYILRIRNNYRILNS